MGDTTLCHGQSASQGRRVEQVSALHNASPATATSNISAQLVEVNMADLLKQRTDQRAKQEGNRLESKPHFHGEYKETHPASPNRSLGGISKQTPWP